MRIHVGNLSPDVDGPKLRATFAPYGEVTSATVVTDAARRRSREFGFVEMPNQAEADAAFRGLAGTLLNGRIMTLSEARPRTADAGLSTADRP